MVKIDRERGAVFISYLYWDRKYDEWIEDIPNRMAPLHTHTYEVGGRLKIGQRIEVLDERNAWLESFVIDETDEQVKIHYKNFHSKFDTWIERGSHRIRPYGRYKLIGLRSRNAVLWSTSIAPSTTSSSSSSSNNAESTAPIEYIHRGTTIVGGPPRNESKSSSSSSSHQQQQNEPGRVRYIGNDTRTRKILEISEQFNAYRKALEDQNYYLHPVSGDGNCLFRSVAHQIYGNDSFHDIVRQKCLEYMESESEFFSQFVVGGMETFHLYLEAKRRDGCWGDDPEIEAMCELYNRPAEIWAYDNQRGARKLRTFHETSHPPAISPMNNHQMTSVNNQNNQNNNNNQATSNNNSNQNHRLMHNNQLEIDPADEFPGYNFQLPHGDPFAFTSSSSQAFPLAGAAVMRLSYYGGGHYDSIIDRNHRSYLIREPPGQFEDRMIALSRRRCLRAHHAHPHETNAAIEEEIASQVAQMTEIEARNQSELDLALLESRRMHLNREYDDLETCLAESLITHQFYPAARVVGGGGAESKRESSSSSSSFRVVGGEESKKESAAPVDEEAVAVQGDVLKSVKEESEREYLDQVILKSLADEEEQMLQAMLLSSAKDEEAKPVGAGGGSAKEEDKDVELALKLSNLSEDEALELALQESLRQSRPTTSSSSSQQQPQRPQQQSQQQQQQSTPAAAQGRNLHALSEEEMLRLAMEESLQSYRSPPPQQSSSSGSYNQSHNHGGGMMFLGEDELDEDLMLAIQASLRK